MEIDGATVLVTGANGFVGGRLCRALAAAGADVRALVRRPGEAEVLDASGIEQVRGEFTDPDDARDAVAGADAVVHAAATAGADLERARRVNRDGTRLLARTALEEGVARFVHISTASVYDRGSHELVDEDTPRVTEGDPYSVTKAEAEREIEAAMADGLAATILRPPAVLGWGPTSTWGQRFPAMLAAGEFPFTPNPDSSHVWVHVDDLADAVTACLRDDRSPGRAYNVVGGHGTWAGYVDAVRSFVAVTVDPFAGEARPAWRGRIGGERIRDELGFEPTRSFDSGMAEAAAAHGA